MIELFSANTPNGKKITIMLEEINFEYKVTKINIQKDQINKLSYTDYDWDIHQGGVESFK